MLLINVRYFSGQLDKRIVSWWQDKIAENEPRTILNKLLESKTEDEDALLFKTISDQSEMIAVRLDLPKPEAAPRSDAESLAQTLVSIEAANFEAATGREISDKAFERLLEDR